MQIFTLIPSGTWASILILVVVSGAAISLRLTLYKKIEEINRKTSRLLSSGESEGIQPPIIAELRNRYQKASKDLEHVNTPALIDSVYKEERLKFSFLNLEYDRADGITRALPNLLIAFGLIGTFWGITSNLTNISSIVTGFSQSNPDVGKLVQGLQLPLQDMGVAFSTSLFGLLAGSILTIINTIWSINIAKYQLISGLEDYLDNIYKPTVEGNTRLDTAIDRMVKQQQEFLTRFHENVGAALERSFGKAANQIAEECGRINQIAENVYTNFSNAAGTISTGASTFQYAAESLESQAKTFANSLDEFKSGVETFKISANQIENNKVTNLGTTQAAFTNSTQTLAVGVEGMMSSHQQAHQVINQVYQGLTTSTSSLQEGSNDLVSAARIIRDSLLAIDLNNAANKWQNTQTEFANSTAIFSQATKNLQPVTANLEPAIASIDRAVNSLQQVGSEVVKLSKNTAQVSESTQIAITGFDRNYQQILNNTESSIQNLGEINRSNWHSLIDLLEKKLQTDRSQNLESIEAMKEHFIKMSLPDPESLARLLTILEQLENGLSIQKNNDSLRGNGDRKSGFFGSSPRN